MSERYKDLSLPEMAYELVDTEFNPSFDFVSYKDAEAMPVDVIKLRHRLIEEELEEYNEAPSEVDRLDALMDLMYVVVGTAVACSLRPSAYVSGQLYRRGSRRLELVYPHVKPLLLELETLVPCTRLLRANLQTAIDRIMNVCKIYGFDSRGAFLAVHENNMQKLWPYDPSSELSTAGLTITQKQKGWLVKRDDGKLLKPPTHTKVDLHPFLPWKPDEQLSSTTR